MVTIKGRVSKGDTPGGGRGTWGKVAGALWDLGWGAAKYLGKHPELYTPKPVVRKSVPPLAGLFDSSPVVTRRAQYSVPEFSDTGKHVSKRHVDASLKTYETLRKRQSDKLFEAHPKVDLGRNAKTMHGMGNTPKPAFDPWVGRADWGPVKTHWPRLYEGKPLDDNDLKQLWHDVDLVRYDSENRMARMKAEALQQYAEQQLAKQMVQQAPKTDQGEVILWGTPVRAVDALGHALQDVRYFREHDRHLGPGQVVASRNRWDVNYNQNAIYKPNQQKILNSNNANKLNDYKSFPNRSGATHDIYPDVTHNFNLYMKKGRLK